MTSRIVSNMNPEVLTHILSHLPANSLSAISLVSKRFYNLVTTPHAWRIAFARYFKGRDALDDNLSGSNSHSLDDDDTNHALRSELRFFTRLTALASWRSEYVLRTRLLRSLARGKPAHLAATHNNAGRSGAGVNNSNATLTYNSQLWTNINHIHANWNNGKKDPHFIHGADETGHACSSDPGLGKVDAWGLNDPQALPQFVDLFPGETLYGLGRGDIIGSPNVMDVSQPYGMIYGEGFPGGLAYYRPPEDKSGKFLACSVFSDDSRVGIPNVTQTSEAICSVWIAKTKTVPTMTQGRVGILTGSSSGIVSAYSLGHDNIGEKRFAKGEITARWILSPGVPIISICVDESYSDRRKAAGRIWVVVLNALGEIFYLSDVPAQPLAEATFPSNDEHMLTKTAWLSGKTVDWKLVEASRREARDDAYHEFEYDGSYSPRLSAYVTNLGTEQIVAEVREVEKFLTFRPSYFQRVCYGWDMRRRLEVDFAGDDLHGAGENIVVVSCGYAEDNAIKLRRYTRLKSQQASLNEFPAPRTPPKMPVTTNMASLFGGGEIKPVTNNAVTAITIDDNTALKAHSTSLVEDWRTANLTMLRKISEITVTCLDMSSLALLTATEDPLLAMGGSASTLSPFGTPSDHEQPSLKDISSIPGHRARFMAVGTNEGSILLWNVRSPQATDASISNDIEPIRAITTDSPQISCLALSSLYLIHGGNDGLVQTWDPLASTMQPVRTLHSRFSSRARRRLVQAEASIQGIGINLFAASAIAIDPDPTVLRGMVSLGTHLRYWSYSSNGADQVSSKKRQLRRGSERGHNSTPDRFVSTGRGVLMDYIATEQEELQVEKQRKAREEARLRGRFGVDFADMSEEEALQYAELISQEAFEEDQQRRISDVSYSISSVKHNTWDVATTPSNSSRTVSRADPVVSSSSFKDDEELSHEIEEAIRLSLMAETHKSSNLPAEENSLFNIPIRYKPKKSKTSPISSPASRPSTKSRTESIAEVDDLEYALQLSLAEEESRQGTKGKGKAWM